MKVETGDWAIAPPGKYREVVPGKKYKILRANNYDFTIDIIHKGSNNFCLFKNCSYLGDKDWIIEKANQTKIYELWT